MSRLLRSRDTVLITGGAGYIGGHVAWACLDAGLQVVVLDDLSTGSRQAVPEHAAFVHGQVQDTATVDDILNRHSIRAIIHLAGSTQVQESIQHPAKYHANNMLHSQRLFQTVAGAQLPIIFASTAAVYSPAAASPLSETAVTEPASPYGVSKLGAEGLLHDTAVSFGFPYLVLRYFNVAGADPLGRVGPAPGSRHLFKAASETALGLRSHLPIHALGDAGGHDCGVRDYLHVCDLAEITVLALASLLDGGGSGVINCGTGRGSSVLDVVAAFEARLARRLPTVRTPPRPGDAPMSWPTSAG